MIDLNNTDTNDILLKTNTFLILQNDCYTICTKYNTVLKRNSSKLLNDFMFCN